MSPEEIKQLKRKAGSWPRFSRKYLIGEMEVEAEKISRLEDTFGKGNIENSDTRASYLEGRPPEGFFNYLGAKLTRVQKMATGLESDAPYWEARRAYIAKGLGIDLTPYVLNLRRFPTFREGGFKVISYGLFEPGPLNLVQPSDIIEKCKILKAKLKP